MTPRRNIELSELQKLFHLTEKQVAKELGVCLTSLKKICRQHGIHRWPYRKVLLQRNCCACVFVRVDMLYVVVLCSMRPPPVFVWLSHLPFCQLKAKSGHSGEGLQRQSPTLSDSPSAQAQGGIMAPVALRAAYPGTDLSDAGMNPMHAVHAAPPGMIPTLDEQPEEPEDLEEGIVLAQACPVDYQVHQSRNIMHAHAARDPVQSQYSMQGMGMMAVPTMVMSYTAPLRPRGMPHGMQQHTVPMHSQFMGANLLSMAAPLPHENAPPSLIGDDSMRYQTGFVGLNDDLVRSHSPGLVNGINSFFADDPQ